MDTSELDFPQKAGIIFLYAIRSSIPLWTMSPTGTSKVSLRIWVLPSGLTRAPPVTVYEAHVLFAKASPFGEGRGGKNTFLKWTTFNF